MSSKLITVRKGYRKGIPKNLFGGGGGESKSSSDPNYVYTSEAGKLYGQIAGSTTVPGLKSKVNNVVGGLGSIVGGIGYNLIGGNYNSGAGLFVNNFGSKIGAGLSAINPLAGGIVSAASGVVGGALNALFGEKVDEQALANANEAIAKNSSKEYDATNYADLNRGTATLNFRNPFSGGILNDSADAKNAIYKKRFIDSLSFADRGYDLAALNIGINNAANLFRNLTAFGGYLDGVDPSTTIGYSLYTDKLVRDNNKNNRSMPNNLIGTNLLAFGGNTQTKGGTWSNGLVHIDTGGSHEANPNEGVLVGVDDLNVPNLVEEGEVIYDDYVFSNRLTVPKRKYAKGGKLKKEDLSYEELVLSPFAGKTFADVAKSLEKKSGAADRPNDSIALRGMQANLEVLKLVLEKEREKEKLEEMQEAIDNMSPEEFEALQQLMLAALQLQMQLEQMAQEQLMIPLGMELMNPLLMELPISALGGILNRKFDYGGDLNQYSKDLGKLGLTLDDYLNYWASINPELEGDTTRIILNDETFDKKEAEKFLNAAKKLKRVYNKKIDINGLGNHGKALFVSDLNKVIANPELLNNDTKGSLSITNYRPSSGNKALRTEGFNKYSVLRDLENFFGNPVLATNGKWNVDYPTPEDALEGYTPNGLTPIENMWHYDSEHNQWLDKDNKVVENPFGEGTLFDNVNTGQDGEFANQDELSLYYIDKITDRFKTLKGNQYDDKRLPRYFLSKEELSKWIEDLLNSDNARDKSLAKMLLANWNLEGDNFVESDAYLGLDETKNNPLQRDKKPGIEHIPYMSAVLPSAARYELLNPDGTRMDEASRIYVLNPTGNPLYTIRDTPLDVLGGVSTYGVIGGNVNPNLVYNNGKFYNITPEQAQQLLEYKIEDPTSLKGWQGYDPYLGYNVNPTVFDITGKDKAWQSLGFEEDDPLTNNDLFPRAPDWPYWLGIGANVGSTLYNMLNPADYSNAEALISAGSKAGKFNPIKFNTIGEYVPYKPNDPWFYTSPILALSNAVLRGIYNKVSPSNDAASVMNGYNTMVSLGLAQRQQLDSDYERLLKSAEFNRGTSMFNSEGQLKADTANLEADSRARAFDLEAKRAGYTMKQAIDDAKAQTISAGLSGIGNALYNYAGNKYYQDLLGWRLRHNLYPISPMEGDTVLAKKGGKIKSRKKRSLSF